MKSSDFNNKVIMFRGDELTLKINKSILSKTRLFQKGNILNITISSILKSENEEVDEICNSLTNWYKAQARRFFIEEVENEKKKYNFSYNDISIKDTVTRWGSCSSKKNFNFNWRLVMAPPEVLRYVVVHEICHLTFMNHSNEFWELVKSRFPNYKEVKIWLKEKGSTLINFRVCDLK